MADRIVVTGLGLITSIGIGREAFWDATLSGRSGGRPIEFDWMRQHGSVFRTRIGAPVADFHPGRFGIEPRDADLLDRVSQFSVAGALLALEDAGFRLVERNGSRQRGRKVEGIDPARLSVILGTGIGGLMTSEVSHGRWARAPRLTMPRYDLPMLIPNAAPAQVAIRVNAQGECKAVATACASGTMAIGDAYRVLRLDEADVVITGGVDAVLSDHDGWGLKGFDLLRATSRRNDEPERASRPFDRDRDGFVLSEGAGILVLEREAFAKARGARIYGTVRGYQSNCDAYHIIMLDPEAEQIVRLMKDLLARSGVEPDEVGYVNAHGTSTLQNDRIESAAIGRAFGRHAERLLVSSTKSQTGHAIGASGGIEAAATLLALSTGTIPPTINYETPDPDCPLNCVPNRPAERKVGLAVSNSFGFGGHNASLLLGRYE